MLFSEGKAIKVIKTARKTRRLHRLSVGLSVTLIAFLLALNIAPTQQAKAAGVVTSCSFFGAGGLAAALAGGGLVTFSLNCTIPFPARYTVTAPTVIDASGYAVTFTGSHAVGLFAVSPGVQLELRKITLTAGKDSAGGGAVYNKGKLIINGGSLTENEAPGGNGGAIYNDGGGVEIYGAQLVYNMASGGNGGAIFNNASLTVKSSRFDKNSASSGGAIYNRSGSVSLANTTLYANNVGANGGAIYNISGALFVQTSTFDSNWNSNGNGGAIYSANIPTSAAYSPQIWTSTFVGNKAGNWGGALYLEAATSQLANSTLTANQANYGGAIYTYKSKLESTNVTVAGNIVTAAANGGSNIFNNGVAAWVIFRNSILSKPGGGGNNCDGTPVTNAGNNIQWPAAAACAGMWVADPILSALAPNGGPTQTMAIAATSPAIDNGNNAICAAAPINNRDQRGFGRPTDGNGDGVFTCDIGAFER